MEEELLNYLVDKSFNEQCKIKDDSYLESNYIISCLIDLGCRVNELLNLEKRFVDFDNNQINFIERKKRSSCSCTYD